MTSSEPNRQPSSSGVSVGDAFISTGYLLGHLQELELKVSDDAPASHSFLLENTEIAELIGKLDGILNRLWLSEFAWKSLDVFVPIYDLLCEMMTLHGMAFARHSEGWQIVQTDQQQERAITTPDLSLYTRDDASTRQSRCYPATADHSSAGDGMCDRTADVAIGKRVLPDDARQVRRNGKDWLLPCRS